jgi:hypothetical protein
MKNFTLILVLALTLGVNSSFFKSINRSHNMSGKARAALVGVKESDNDDDNQDEDVYRNADDNEDDEDNAGGSSDSTKDKKSGISPGDEDAD